MKREGDEICDLTPGLCLKELNPRKLGVFVREVCDGEDTVGIFPEYFMIKDEPPDGLRWSLRYMASSTNV